MERPRLSIVDHQEAGYASIPPLAGHNMPVLGARRLTFRVLPMSPGGMASDLVVTGVVTAVLFQYIIQGIVL